MVIYFYIFHLLHPRSYYIYKYILFLLFFQFKYLKTSSMLYSLTYLKVYFLTLPNKAFSSFHFVILSLLRCQKIYSIKFSFKHSFYFMSQYIIIFLNVLFVLEKSIYSIAIGWSLLHMSIRLILLILLFTYSISLLIFFLLHQFLAIVNFCFIYEATLFGTCK